MFSPRLFWFEDKYISGEMDTQPSVDLVVEAIKSLYNNPNPTLKEEAGR